MDNVPGAHPSAQEGGKPVHLAHGAHLDIRQIVTRQSGRASAVNCLR